MICSGMSFIPAADHQAMFQPHQDTPYPPSTSPNLLASSCAPLQDFHGVSPILMRRSMSFPGIDRCEEMRADDDMSDDGSQLGEKKKRLNVEQVKALEKSFQLGNKLEPERKMQLARALGLKPRQIAIWFQNRRARWKTKQLEKDYDLLKKQFGALKSDNDALKSQNKKLQAELLVLKSKTRESTATGPPNLNKETENSWSNGSDNSCDVKMGTTKTPSEGNSLYSHASNRHIFSSSISIGPTSLVQVLQGSSQHSVHHPICPKNDQTVQDQGFCNIFHSIDDQPACFWPWPAEQHRLQ